MIYGDQVVQNHPVSQPSRAQPPSLEQGMPQDLCTQARAVPSGELLRGNRSVDISHNGSVYRLQATKSGKLILTK